LWKIQSLFIVAHEGSPVTSVRKNSVLKLNSQMGAKFLMRERP
jgi:hypothetical protein